MSEEEFLKRNNYLMSHGHLPYDTTTCETWGLSGNCGKNCPNFKNKTCDVYVDVLERVNQELQQQNQKYKETVDKAIHLLDQFDAWLEPQDFLKLKKIEKVLEEVNK